MYCCDDLISLRGWVKSSIHPSIHPSILPPSPNKAKTKNSAFLIWLILLKGGKHNIRRTLHIIEQANKQKLNAALVTLDAEKPFDRVSWPFLFSVLKWFGVDNQLVGCIQSLCSYPKARIKIISQAIRQNSDLKGVFIAEEEHKRGLFADDIITYLQNPDSTFPILMKVLEGFGQLSGYQLIISKTQVLFINYWPSRNIQHH